MGRAVQKNTWGHEDIVCNIFCVLLTFAQSSIPLTLFVLNNGELTLIIFFQVNYKACIIECFSYAFALI